jgi:4-hydroxymandelate oxidase
VADPIHLADFEAIARATMRAEDYELVASTAEGNLTMNRTRAAWDSLALRPRVLPGARAADLRVEVLGRALALPILLAPAGFHTRAHPDGELATARAATTVGTIMAVSANSGHPAADVAAAADGPKWLQMYLFRDRAETVRRVRLAEDAGFAAICLTLDAHWPAKRDGRVRRRPPTDDEGGAEAGSPAPTGAATSATGPATPAAGSAAGAAADAATDPGITRFDPARRPARVMPDPAATWADPGATWDDVAWLRSITTLPIVGKGIMTGEDARAAIERGLDAIVVSNHGGRLDNTAATIEVLPEIVAAVDGRLEVYLDGGIRRGADVVKALALGARAVLIGRPVFWGLAHGGIAGLVLLLDLLREEVEATMMLCSRPAIADLDPTLVTRLPDLASPHVRS